jgi:hypothetical protein
MAKLGLSASTETHNRRRWTNMGLVFEACGCIAYGGISDSDELTAVEQEMLSELEDNDRDAEPVA